MKILFTWIMVFVLVNGEETTTQTSTDINSSPQPNKEETTTQKPIDMYASQQPNKEGTPTQKTITISSQPKKMTNHRRGSSFTSLTPSSPSWNQNAGAVGVGGGGGLGGGGLLTGLFSGLVTGMEIDEL